MTPYPTYKDSGIEWLGKIPAGWKVKSLKHAVKINQATLPENADENCQIQYIDIGNVNQNGFSSPPKIMTFGASPSRARRITKRYDTIISTVRTYLKAIAYIDSDENNLIASTGFAVLTPTNQMYPKYLYYSVSCPQFIETVSALSVGVSYPAINSSDLGNIPIWLPDSLQEQHTIAAFLDRKTRLIDTYIAKKQQQIARLQTYRAALINQAVTKGLNPDAPMKDSGIEWLGEIPEHWEVKRVKFVVKNMVAGPFGSSLTKDMYVKEGYRVYGQEQVIPADFTIGDYYISKEKYQEMNRYAVAPGDVLVSCVGTFGKIAVVPESIEPGIINPRLIKLTLRKEHIIPNYFGIILSDRVAFNQLERISRGGTMGVINIGLLSELLLPVPPIGEQQIIIDFLAQMIAKIDTLITSTQRQIERLHAYRTSLISDAVTGKIDVRDYKDENYKDCA